jgi:hypothetical protein
VARRLNWGLLLGMLYSLLFWAGIIAGGLLALNMYLDMIN